ncbi:Metabotropic glutamate receptor 3 [Holothuria leucospilota]|uniref:Metabotropic glutamate receptor 3 n=1 Tax=Holothuria leucospilota TaxID=206669 RepID=A0A9Q1CLS5_HOLLE|nr:Metabotropic glutamate receptor 3 [Holothuria leucospilota]
MIMGYEHLLLVFLFSFGSYSLPSKEIPQPENVFLKGDFILGGLFPVHEKGKDISRCGRINEERGIQRLEAMLFAIDKINNDTTILEDWTLGADIRDTCSQDTYALEQSLEFVRSSLTTVEVGADGCVFNDANNDTEGRVVGAVGGSDSDVSIQVANLLRLFEIPQISYASTSARLSDTSRYDYFARTVPPDTLQAKALADIVLLFNWTYVMTVASEGQYGEAGIDQFEKEATARNICIAESEEIPFNADESVYDNVISQLKQNKKAKVVVLFTTGHDAREVLAAFQRDNTNHSFILIASDGWGVQDEPIRDKEEIAEGALTIELQAKHVPEFDEYFLKLQPGENHRNPWFDEFWDQKFRCISSTALASNTTAETCRQNRLHSGNHVQEKKIQFVIDAVYAFAYALQGMVHDLCPETKEDCPEMFPVDGKLLFTDYILNVSFNDPVNSEVKFDSQGDGLGRYDIMTFQRDPSTGDFVYKPIGNWSTMKGLQMEKEKIVFHPSVLISPGDEFPQSKCSLPCEKGEYKDIQEEQCCWVCLKCEPWAYLEDEFTCVECPIGFWPNEDLTACYRLPQEHVTLWEFHGIPVAISLTGMLSTFSIFLVFVKHNNTPIVKASSRELSYLLLMGILLCYSMTFALLSKPSTTVCSLQRLGLGASFCICFSALLTRTNRISRIFNSATRSAQRPKYISPKSQLIICLLLISVQLAGEVVWLLVHPPKEVIKHSKDRSEARLTCSISDTDLVISLAYDMALIVLCTLYAFKSRKIPENFNEAKFIAFTMYTTCVIWLAFLPVFIVTNEYFKIQTTTLCISVSLSATVALCCLFVPKVYIIVFQPHKNVRSLRSTSTRRSYLDSASNPRSRGDFNTNSLYVAPTAVHNGKDQKLINSGKLTVTFNSVVTQPEAQTDVETSQAYL